MAVKLARTRKRWSQAELAQAAGVGRTYVSEVERGARNPALETQAKLAAALGVSLADLVAAAEQQIGGYR
jgi:transcriptional regulator with XRE-family HTH domain